MSFDFSQLGGLLTRTPGFTPPPATGLMTRVRQENQRQFNNELALRDQENQDQQIRNQTAGVRMGVEKYGDARELQKLGLMEKYAAYQQAGDIEGMGAVAEVARRWGISRAEISGQGALAKPDTGAATIENSPESLGANPSITSLDNEAPAPVKVTGQSNTRPAAASSSPLKSLSFFAPAVEATPAAAAPKAAWGAKAAAPAAAQVKAPLAAPEEQGLEFDADAELAKSQSEKGSSPELPPEYVEGGAPEWLRDEMARRGDLPAAGKEPAPLRPEQVATAEASLAHATGQGEERYSTGRAASEADSWRRKFQGAPRAYQRFLEYVRDGANPEAALAMVRSEGMPESEQQDWLANNALRLTSPTQALQAVYNDIPNGPAGPDERSPSHVNPPFALPPGVNFPGPMDRAGQGAFSSLNAGRSAMGPAQAVQRASQAAVSASAAPEAVAPASSGDSRAMGGKPEDRYAQPSGSGWVETATGRVVTKAHNPHRLEYVTDALSPYAQKYPNEVALGRQMAAHSEQASGQEIIQYVMSLIEKDKMMQTTLSRASMRRGGPAAMGAGTAKNSFERVFHDYLVGHGFQKLNDEYRSLADAEEKALDLEARLARGEKPDNMELKEQVGMLVRSLERGATSNEDRRQIAEPTFWDRFGSLKAQVFSNQALSDDQIAQLLRVTHRAHKRKLGQVDQFEAAATDAMLGKDRRGTFATMGLPSEEIARLPEYIRNQLRNAPRAHTPEGYDGTGGGDEKKTSSSEASSGTENSAELTEDNFNEGSR